MDGKWISDIRVSTARLGKFGLGLQAQRKAVEDYLNGGRWKMVKEFVEVESGRRIDLGEGNPGMPRLWCQAAYRQARRLSRF